MKVIIAGSRDLDDYDFVKIWCMYYFKDTEEIEIVSGTARGADRLGERFAEEMGYPIKKFPADWVKHRKSAGVLRNIEMAEYADGLIAFWDGKSKGTKSMIDLARSKNLKVRIIQYK